MNVRFVRMRDALRTNFWFVPTMMAVLAILLSFATITLGSVFKDQVIDGFGFTRGPEGARTLLSTVASSVMTVASVTFSITINTVSSHGSLENNRGKKIRKTCTIGMRRTPAQDVRFAIDQVVEVAVRAISSAINDPFTAITCLDWLGMALCHLDKRNLPSLALYDQEKHVRVITRPLTFEDITDVAFNKIRYASQTNVAVIIHLLETIGLVAAQTKTRELRSALLRHANLVAVDCLQGQSDQSGQQAITLHYQAVMEQLSSDST